jgi:hypothetical protein
VHFDNIQQIKPTNALYFLGMFINRTHVSAATEPSSGVQGHFGSVAAETCVGLMNIHKK